MWLCSAALTAAMSIGGPLTDLNDKLDAESKADAEDRLRNSESEISELERIRDSRFYENAALSVEVKQHKEQIDDHSQSLQTANALAEKSGKSHVLEKEQTAQALKQLRKAMDIV